MDVPGICFKQVEEIIEFESGGYAMEHSRLSSQQQVNGVVIHTFGAARSMAQGAAQRSLADLDIFLERQWSRTMSMGSSASRQVFNGSPNKEHEQQEEEATVAASPPGAAAAPCMQVIDMSQLVIREVIGVGAIGKVHRGFYNGQEVAIKLLDCSRPGQAGDGVSDWRRLGLMKELRIWRKLQHPNIVRFIGASTGVFDKHALSNVCCLVSEYMSQGTLRDYLLAARGRNRLSFKMILHLAIDIAKGLEYLHSKRIVHRDLKTSNILLDSELRAKIGDFDSARVEAENLSDMSGEIGTTGYMAPEVFDGRAYGCNSDVYSFGICLLEIYCCDMAYGMLCLSLADITKGLVYRNLRPKIPKSCPSQLSYVMKRCWKKNPDKRPTMSEVVQMLEAINPDKAGNSSEQLKNNSSEQHVQLKSNLSLASSQRPQVPLSAVCPYPADMLLACNMNFKVNWL